MLRTQRTPTIAWIAVGRALAAAILVGLCTGFFDAIFVHFDIGGSRGAANLTPREWCWILLAWTLVCVTAQLLFLFHPIQKLAGAAVIMSGPGLFLISRGGPVLKHTAGLSLSTATVVSLAAAVGVSYALRRIGTTSQKRYAVFALCSLIVASLLLTLALSTSNRRHFAAKAAKLTNSDAPNIVLIVLDTLRYDDSQHMPNLAGFASKAIVFENAWATAPSTVPSHFAMLTGKQPWAVPFDAHTERFQYDGPTLAEALTARGYRTGAVFANPLLSPGTVFSRGFQAFGFSDYSACRSGLGFLLVRGFTALGRQSPMCVGVWMRASEVTERAVRFIRQTEDPYFLALNYLDAHDPYIVGNQCRSKDFRPYTALDGASLLEAGLYGTPVSADAVTRIHNQYRVAISCMDRSLGTLFEEIRRSQKRKATVVAVVADHGEHFGEQGFMGHGRTLYSQVLHVPLLLQVPGYDRYRVSEPVTTLDIYRTLLQFTDRSRSPRLLSAERSPVVAHCFVPKNEHLASSSLFCVIRGRYHLLRSDDGHEEIYDYVKDPAELLPISSVEDDVRISDLRKGIPTLSNQNVTTPVSVRGLGYLQ